MTGPDPFASEDEHQLWAALLEGDWPRDAGRRLGMASKRVRSLCEKWADKGYYNYGVSADLGWPEPQPGDWQERSEARRAAGN